MKKTNQTGASAPREKGFFALAGEAFHVLGEEIVEGKDKVVEVAADKFSAVKQAIHKITHKNSAPTRRTVKKVAKKAAPKKAAGKVVAASKKVVRKTVTRAATAKRKG